MLAFPQEQISHYTTVTTSYESLDKETYVILCGQCGCVTVVSLLCLYTVYMYIDKGMITTCTIMYIHVEVTSYYEQDVREAYACFFSE